MHRCDAVLVKMLTTQPTTMEGAIFLLEHLGQHEFLEIDKGDHHTFLTTFADCGGEPPKLVGDFPLRLAAALRKIAGV